MQDIKSKKIVDICSWCNFLLFHRWSGDQVQFHFTRSHFSWFLLLSRKLICQRDQRSKKTSLFSTKSREKENGCFFLPLLLWICKGKLNWDNWGISNMMHIPIPIQRSSSAVNGFDSTVLSLFNFNSLVQQLGCQLNLKNTVFGPIFKTFSSDWFFTPFFRREEDGQRYFKHTGLFILMFVWLNWCVNCWWRYQPNCSWWYQ